MSVNVAKSKTVGNGLKGQEAELITQHFPFELGELDEGLKYLGFCLKPNCYSKQNWMWLVARIEKRIKAWYFRWARPH